MELSNGKLLCIREGLLLGILIVLDIKIMYGTKLGFLLELSLGSELWESLIADGFQTVTVDGTKFKLVSYPDLEFLTSFTVIVPELEPLSPNFHSLLIARRTCKVQTPFAFVEHSMLPDLFP